MNIIVAKESTKSVVLKEDHSYEFVLRGRGSNFVKTDTILTTQASCTGIINPGGVPNIPLIAEAAKYGTVVHKALLRQMMGGNDLSGVRASLNSSYGQVVSCSVMSILRKLSSLTNIGTLVDCDNDGGAEPETPLIGSVSFVHEGQAQHHFFGATPDLVYRNHCGTVGKVFEFKTTTKKSKSHMVQLAVYMVLTGAPKGYLIYDDPHIATVCMNAAEANMIVCNDFAVKAARYFLGTRVMAGEIPDKISAISQEIYDLSKESSAKSKERSKLLDDLLILDEYKGERLIFGDYKLTKEVSLGSEIVDIDKFRATHPKIYDQFIKNKIRTSVVFRKKNEVNNEQ